MTVGSRIKQRRLELGMTQSELAEKMGYKGKTSVCAAENCGDNITTTKVQKFADALGVSLQYLMGYEDLKPIEIELPKFTPDVKRAMELYKMYANVSPEIQSAVETLLKSAQHKQ